MVFKLDLRERHQSARRVGEVRNWLIVVRLKLGSVLGVEVTKGNCPPSPEMR